MYGKLIDGKLIKAKHFILADKETIINPTSDMYRKHGFKEIKENEMPEIEEGQLLNVWYEETDNEIIKHYDVKEAEIE